MTAGLLACPRCRGALTPAGEMLRCGGCGVRYPMEDGVPDLLPWSGGEPGPEWDLWREKLHRLQAWRRATWTGTATAAVRQQEADDVASAFFAFARIPERACVLEVGCGAGDLHRFLPGRQYVGVDPMPLAVGPVPTLVRGVGERLPVVGGGFDAVLLCETLDHALDPSRVLGEAGRALREGGVLAIQQSVRVDAPRAPLPVRMRVTAGRMRARLAGTLPPDEADTKMHVFTEETLRALAERELPVQDVLTRGGTAFLRAVKGERGCPA